MTEKKIGSTKLVLTIGDITKEETDAIVNAANSSLMGGGGVDGAIHRAGGPSILKECKKIIQRIGTLPPGEAVITGGGNLKAKFVIHTVGPVWRGGSKGEATTLANAYNSCLELAQDASINSLSFPSISTGAYGYPIADAALIALSTITDFLKTNAFLSEVHIVLFSSSDYTVYQTTLEKIIGK